MVAHASSFDTVGILAKTVDECARVLHVMAGPDGYDHTASPVHTPTANPSPALGRRYRVAFFPEVIEHEGLQAEIRAAVNGFVGQLQEQGHHLSPAHFPLFDALLPTYYLLTAAEASTNLARYNGVRYGYRDCTAEDIHALYAKSRAVLGKEVQRRILLGTFVLSEGYYQAYYTQAQKVRRRIQQTLEALFRDYDFLLLPTTPTTAFPLGKHAGDPAQEYLADVYTVLASLAGFPALSIPYGSDRQGLPIGLQLIAPPLRKRIS